MTKSFDNYGIAYYLHQYWIWRKLLTIKTYHTIYISNVYDESFWQLRQHTIYISNEYDESFWQLRHSILFTSVMNMTKAFAYYLHHNEYDESFWQLRHSILFTSVMYMTKAFDN